MLMLPTSTEQDGNASASMVVMERMRGLLRKEFHCTLLSDGRMARGAFVCINQLFNIILQNVVKQRPLQTNTRTTISDDDDNPSYMNRHLSQALVPGKHLTHVQIRTDHFRNDSSLPRIASITQEPTKCMSQPNHE